MSKILTIQDYSIYGQCSLTVALPILSALSHETVAFPTAILSTHTYNFKDFYVKDLEPDFIKVLEHWKKENLKFDCLYTGYIGSTNIIDIIKTIKVDFLKPDSLVIVDPAFGDKGKLYPLFNQTYVDKMKELAFSADIILPNVTEACFLADIPYKDNYDEQFVIDLLTKLSLKGLRKIILTNVSFDPKTTGVYAFIDDVYSYYKHEKITEGYHGTGDIFSSVFVGSYLKDNDIYKAIKKAADFVYNSIKATMDDPSHWYGVKFEPELKKLMK